MSDKYKLTLNIEKSGTLYTDQDTNITSTSIAGHMWLSAQKNNETPLEFGFASESGKPFDVGKLKRNDGISYHGDPHFSRTIEITQKQFDDINSFFTKGSHSSFDGSRYNLITNNCISAAWSALEHIGFTTGGFKGNLYPTDNIRPINELFNNQNKFYQDSWSYKNSLNSINHWNDYWDPNTYDHPWADKFLETGSDTNILNPFNYEKYYEFLHSSKYRETKSYISGGYITIEIGNDIADLYIGWAGSTLKEGLEYMISNSTADGLWTVSGDENYPTLRGYHLTDLHEALSVDPTGAFANILEIADTQTISISDNFDENDMYDFEDMHLGEEFMQSILEFETLAPEPEAEVSATQMIKIENLDKIVQEMNAFNPDNSAINLTDLSKSNQNAINLYAQGI